jgi:hypothetical protein
LLVGISEGKGTGGEAMDTRGTLSLNLKVRIKCLGSCSLWSAYQSGFVSSYSDCHNFTYKHIWIVHVVVY